MNNTIKHPIMKNMIDKFIFFAKNTSSEIYNKFGYAIVRAEMNGFVSNIACETGEILEYPDSMLLDIVSHIISIFWGECIDIYVPKNSKTVYLFDSFVGHLINNRKEESMMFKYSAIKENNRENNIIIVKTDKALSDFVELYGDGAEAMYYNFRFNDQYYLLIYYDNDKPVGIGTLFFNKDSAGIYDLYTDPEYRKTGVASSMITYMSNYSFKKGYDKMCITTDNFYAQELYKKNGFMLFDKIYKYHRNTKRK